MRGGHRRFSWWLAVVTGCANAGGVDPGADARGVVDASEPSDADCSMTWYADLDADGHGDPQSAMSACTQPALTSATSGDCDDADFTRFPGAPEICDGVDTDCDPASAEQCPAGCQGVKRPPPDVMRAYMFCSGAASWANARATCASAMGFHLIQLDDAAENTWLRTTANTVLGNVVLHIGGSDGAAEGAWRWDGSNAQFWQGGSGGAPVAGLFAAWDPGEPNDDGTEDCGELRTDGRWNDGSCGDSQRFVCER